MGSWPMCALAVVTFPPYLVMTRDGAEYYTLGEKNLWRLIGKRQVGVGPIVSIS
jgi:hypothetical protein